MLLTSNTSRLASAASVLKWRNALAWSVFIFIFFFSFCFLGFFFFKLKRLWKGSQLSISAKVKLFCTTCVTIFLYGWGSWVLSLDMESKINAFSTFWYRNMLGIKRLDCIFANYSITSTEPLGYYVRRRQLGFLSMDTSLIFQRKSLQEDMLFMYHLMAKESWVVYAPLTSRTYNGVLGYHEVDISADEIATLPEDRCAWRNLIIACSTAKGWWWWWWESNQVSCPCRDTNTLAAARH